MNKRYSYSFSLLLLITFSFSSCATLFTKKQTVTVTSDIVGAKVYKGSKFVGTTPLTFQTKSAKSTFTVVKDGYAPQTINTDVTIRWNTLWNWFNCWTGWFVDIAAGTTQKYTKNDYFISLKDPSINIAYNNQHEHQYNTIAFEQVAGAVANATVQGIAAGQQRQAEINQREAEREAQQYAEQQARVAQNKQKYTDFQAITNKSADSSNHQSYPITTSQGNYNDLLTSDAAWNTQVQMWVQQYGVEKTREIVNKKRANDYQQSVQTNQSNSQTQAGKERIISAVTSSRQQVKIKIRGNVIIAYSIGLDKIGRQNWKAVVPSANISKTGAGTLYDDSGLNKEFSYTSKVGNTQIYFDM